MNTRMLTALSASFALTALAQPTNTMPAAAPAPQARFSGRFESLAVPAGFTNMVVVVDFPPGAVFPLHKHGGPLLGLVLSGTLTVHQNGRTTTYAAGQSFTEPLGQVHDVANSTDRTVTVVLSYLLPRGAQPDILVKQ
ncbi:cupin domain-containing protein [Deinococcus pimensis]|uniref:cupin domain-containing protein n=1 Tax=Deinococcus pimensis TaxID=309888 RepID=UPI0004BA8E2B|nr:cupin domain-containing protein [Deinococcus pimensis]